MPLSSLRPIPFDAFTLAAVADEIRSFVGGRVQAARQPDDLSLAIEFYFQGSKRWLLLSAHPQLARVHFVSTRPNSLAPPPPMLVTARAKLVGAILQSVTQLAADRVLLLRFSTEFGDLQLIAEVMGKHSNVILVADKEGARALRILEAIKRVTPSQSRRPVQRGGEYRVPPILSDAPDISKSMAPQDVAKLTKTRLCNALTSFPDQWQPILDKPFGAYPVPLNELGYGGIGYASISDALEQHFSKQVLVANLDSEKDRVARALERGLAKKRATLATLETLIAEGLGAARLQRSAELVLAFASSITSGSNQAEVMNYEGETETIPLDPRKSAVENAGIMFDKAKRSKERLVAIQNQAQQLRIQIETISELLSRAEAAESEVDLVSVRDSAIELKLLQRHVDKEASAPKRWDGFKIREATSPSGLTILWGENATSNDYLTTRVANSSDLWLHVSGASSAHVVIRTQGKPERVQKPDLNFAAKIAVANSAQKHSSYVPVIYVEKRFVRKPKGAKPGSVVCSREKTLYVEAER